MQWIMTRCTHLDFVDVKPRWQVLQCQANFLNLCWATSNKTRCIGTILPFYLTWPGVKKLNNCKYIISYSISSLFSIFCEKYNTPSACYIFHPRVGKLKNVENDEKQKTIKNLHNLPYLIIYEKVITKSRKVFYQIYIQKRSKQTFLLLLLQCHSANNHLLQTFQDMVS